MKAYGPICVLTLALAIANVIQAAVQVTMAESPSVTKSASPQVLPPAGCWYSFTSGAGTVGDC